MLDTSFVIGDTLSNHILNTEGFLEQCISIKSIGSRGIRILPPIFKEIMTIIGEYRMHPAVRQGIRLLHQIRKVPPTPYMQDVHIFDFLVKKIGSESKFLRIPGNDGLSQNDIEYGAYAVLKTIKGDVIAATRDNLLINTIERVYNISHPVFVERGYPNRTLQIARDKSELQAKLATIMEIRQERTKKLCPAASSIENQASPQDSLSYVSS